MKTKLLSIILMCISFLCYSQAPANDDCANVELIVVPTTGSPLFVNTDTSMATQSTINSCENVSQTWLDQWYEFIMPINGNIAITAADGFDNFTLYDACAGSEIQCGTGNEFYFSLTMGTTYILRYSQRDIYANVKSFSIKAFETVINDECTNIESITVTTASTTTVATNTLGATQSTVNSCENAAQIFMDQWYEFTMPVNGNIAISAADGLDNFTLYDACAGSEIQCGTGNEFYFSLTMGTTYILRYSQRDIYAAEKAFNIQAFETVINDECTNIESITVTTASTTTVATNTLGATQSTVNSCENAAQIFMDQWYEFTMPVNGNIAISAADGLDNFTLYDACAGSEIQCGTGNEFYFSLTMETTYILRYSQRDIYAAEKAFNIQAFETVINDECTNIESITVTTASTTTVATNTLGATQSTVNSCENAAQIFMDQWYEFTMPVNGNIAISAADAFDNFTLYDICAGTEMLCDSGNQFMYSLAMGTTYILRYSQRDIYAAEKAFNIQAFEAIPNDTCANAELIQVAGLGVCTSENVTVDLRGATVSSAISSCFNASQTWMDAWYTFEAPLTGNININVPGGLDNFTVYNACNSTEIICDTNDGVIPVVFGQTYLLQIIKRDIYVNDAITFCLEGAPQVATGTTGVCETIPTVDISIVAGNTSEWVPVLDISGNIVAAINANGNDLGTINTTLFIDSTDTRIADGQPYSRREVSITPSTQPASNVSVRIYSLEDEVADLILADNNMGSYLNLNMMHVDGSNCTTGYTSGGDFINASTWFYSNDYYTSFNTNTFSVFYPTSTNLDSTLSAETFENTLGLSIYPTISNGVININTENNLGKSSLSVLDINGREVYASEVNLGSNAIQINLENYSKGLYFLKIENYGSVNTQKIILK